MRCSDPSHPATTAAVAMDVRAGAAATRRPHIASTRAIYSLRSRQPGPEVVTTAETRIDPRRRRISPGHRTTNSLSTPSFSFSLDLGDYDHRRRTGSGHNCTDPSPSLLVYRKKMGRNTFSLELNFGVFGSHQPSFNFRVQSIAGSTTVGFSRKEQQEQQARATGKNRQEQARTGTRRARTA